MLNKIKEFLIGKALDPRKSEARQHTILAAFLAWIGLGADGLSSACYGPEAAYLALGNHPYFAIYLAIAITVTVFIIALSYNQVIELFPSGGGGYKVATHLIHPYAGLVSGAALIIDYILTISISIASGSDALFSLFPVDFQNYKQTFEVLILAVLLFLNLRGMKESIQILMPIFLTFFISHVILILYGIFQHKTGLSVIVPEIHSDTVNLSRDMGWVVILAILFRAYSLGGGTYTGIEAVSNNINRLEPPRVRTGKLTMMYMAFSLAFVASGIMLIYLLQNVKPVPGETLNAVAFRSVLENWVYKNFDFGYYIFILVMFAEASLLYVAANTGYLGGPAVLANMAADSWVPIQFRYLSSRLVTQNGLLLMGLASLLILIWTQGQVQLLLVMYSINVFLTFSLSLLGLCIYWWKNNPPNKNRVWRFLLSLLGFFVTTSILVITLVEKFTEGGWVTLLLTGILILICLIIKHHYSSVKRAVDRLSHEFEVEEKETVEPESVLPINPNDPTAIFFVGEYEGIALHVLKVVLALFPNRYKNIVFLSVAEIDAQNLEEDTQIKDEGRKITRRLSHLINYCRAHHLAAVHYLSYDIDAIDGLTHLAEKMSVRYPSAVFFAGTLIFDHINWIYQWLHNKTAMLIQQRLNTKGLYVMLVPIQITITN